jgi:hypothetical protein
MNEHRDQIRQSFRFDIGENSYWHPLFGAKPAEVEDAIALAIAFVDRAPPLIPVFGHRYLVADPAVKTRAVLSVYQAVDSIVYGNDLADYLSREFGIPNPEWSSEEAPRVPVWEDLFDLWGEWELP